MRQNVNVPSETSNAHICWVLYIDDTNGMVQPAYRWINTHCSSGTEMNGYVYVKYGAIRTVKRLIRDQYYVVSCVFQIVLLLWLFSFCKKSLKNKTVTTKIAYAALFLWIVLCIFRFCLLQFSVLTRKKKWKNCLIDTVFCVLNRIHWNWKQKQKIGRKITAIFSYCSGYCGWK